MINLGFFQTSGVRSKTASERSLFGSVAAELISNKSLQPSSPGLDEESNTKEDHTMADTNGTPEKSGSASGSDSRFAKKFLKIDASIERM